MMLAVAGQDPSAEIVAQRIMNNPLILNGGSSRG